MVAELVQVAGVGPVADIGCGPGNVTAHLHSLGMNTLATRCRSTVTDGRQTGSPSW